MKKIALAALLASAFTVSHAAVITFDDINSATVANGYDGLNWSNFYVVNGTTFTNSGYQNGVVSPKNVALNGYASPAVISATSAAGFDLYSGFFTGAWNNGLQVQANAVFENSSTASLTFTVNTTGPSNEIFNWTDLSSVTFTSFGGTSAGLSGGGAHFVVDNLTTTSPVPEPANVALLLAGLGMMGVVARRRKA